MLSCVARQRNMYLLKIGFSRITPANIFGLNFTSICRLNSNLTLWAKGAQNGGEKGTCFFCNGYSELAFFVTEQIGMKFGKNVNLYALLNLNRRILKIFP